MCTAGLGAEEGVTALNSYSSRHMAPNEWEMQARFYTHTFQATWHPMSGKHKHKTACDVPAHFKCARCCVAQDLAPNEWETHSMSGKHKHETACNLSARIKCVRCCVVQDLAPNEWETHSMSGKHKMELHAMCQHTIIVRSAV